VSALSITSDIVNWSYSIKSAYRLCVQELIDTSHLNVPGQWHLIWQVGAPPKIKILLWHSCLCYFLTRFYLYKRRVKCPIKRVFCTDAPTCRRFSSHIVCFFSCQQHLPVADSALSASIISSIWKQHKKKVWNNTLDPRNHVIIWADELLRGWSAVWTIKNQSAKSSNDKSNLKCKKPEAGG